MIKRNILKSILPLLALAILFTSCGTSDFLFPQEMNNAEKIKPYWDECLKQINDSTVEISTVRISSKDALSNEWNNFTFEQIDDSGRLAAFVYNKLTKSIKAETKPGATGKLITSPLKNVNIAKIPSAYAEAVKQIPAEYENFVLSDYDIKAMPNEKFKYRFTVNATKKGEGKSRQGRMVTTTYYDFNFDLDDTGKPTLKK